MRCGKDQGCLMRSGWSPCCALMMMIERQRATRARACVCGRVEGCSSARSLVGVTIMYLRSSVHFIRRWPFSPASCTSYRCLTLPSRFWRPAPQPLVTFAPAPLACTSWSLPPSRLSPPRISRRLPGGGGGGGGGDFLSAFFLPLARADSIIAR